MRDGTMEDFVLVYLSVICLKFGRDENTFFALHDHSGQNTTIFLKINK